MIYRVEKLSDGKISWFKQIAERVRKEASKTIVGQEEVFERLFMGLLCDGNVLIEGMPGTAKTLMVRTLASLSGCDFKRIQFTPDLLPSDIVGITAYSKDRGFYVVKGPVFANFVLANGINRSPPKVQSALLEAMQERQVTIGQETFPLPKPFFVIATQNPIEAQGTYSLPEAQVDRFLFKSIVEYGGKSGEKRILDQNVSLKSFDDFGVKPVLSPGRILELQALVKRVYLGERTEQYVVSLVDATRNPRKHGVSKGKYVEWGASPRASISLYIAAKAAALMQGRTFATPQHVKEVAHDVLRHRLILNYEGQAQGVTSDAIIAELLERVPVP